MKLLEEKFIQITQFHFLVPSLDKPKLIREFVARCSLDETGGWRADVSELITTEEGTPESGPMGLTTTEVQYSILLVEEKRVLDKGLWSALQYAMEQALHEEFMTCLGKGPEDYPLKEWA